MARITKRRRGAIRSAASGILAVIILIAVINFWGLPKKIAYASFETANKVTDEIGLDELISLPKITAIELTVGNDGTLNVNWKANKDGRRVLSEGTTDIRITFLRREIPGAQLEKYCVAYKLNTGAENAKEEAEAKAKGVWCKVNPDGIGSAALKGSADGSKPAPGGDYTVIVAMKEKDDAGFGESTEKSYKFYTEEFVELLDKPIQGCDFPFMNNCNVIECKKTIMNRAADTSGVLAVKGEIERIAEEVVSGTCAAYDPAKSPMVDFAACTKPEDIDFVNTRFARLRMFRAAHSDVVLKSESGYINFFDKVSDFKQLGLINSLACSNGEGLFKGAYGHLNSLEWAGEGTFDKWKTKTSEELDRVLMEELSPAVANLKAEVGPSKAIALRWDALGIGNIDHYEVEHCWRKYARDKHFVSDAGGVELGGEESSCDPVDKRPSDVEFAIVPAGAPAGVHGFVLKVIKKDSGTITKELKAGFFVNDYIELYKGAYGYPKYKDKSKKGIITVCVRSPYATKDDNCDNDPNPDWGNLAECDEKCDVFEKKRSAFRLKQVSNNDILFKDDVVVRVEAFDNWRKDKSTLCEYKKEDAGFNTYNLELDGCSPGEVSQLYDALVRKAYPAEPWLGFYSCTPKKTGSDWEANWQKTNLNKFDVNHELVCKAKGELAKSLGNSNSEKGLNWAYFAS